MRANTYITVLITNIVMFFGRTRAKHWSGDFWLELLFTCIISLTVVWVLEGITKRLGWKR